MIGLARVRRPVAIVLLVAFLPACGTVFNGTRQNITANSTPEAARVTTTPPTGEVTTPITLRLERKKSYSIRFERDGYSPATVEIQNKLNVGILILDIVFGLVPVIVDAATGGWYKLHPGSALVVLTRVAQGDGPEKIHIGLTDGTQSGVRTLDVSADVPGVTVRVEER